MASISASHSNISIILDVNETATSTAGNYSDVSWTLRMVRPYRIYSNVAKNYSVTINGNTTSGTVIVGGVGDFNIATGSHRIYHEADGSKSIGISFSQELNLDYNGHVGTLSAEGNMGLTKIDRQAFVTGANNVNDEQNPYMEFTNPVGYDMWAELEINPNNTHLFGRTIPNTGNYTFELTEQERETMRSYLPTSNSGKLRYLIYSNNRQFVSYIDKTYSIINANPEFENFIYQDTNNDIVAVTGNNQVLVKGLSTLQATISVANKMTAIKQATEKNYVATIGTINQSINYDDENDIVFNLGEINTAGTQRLNIRAYDSRNNSTLIYKDIIVYDYAKPVVNFTAERLNNFENQTTLKISGSFSSLNIDNVEKNTIQSVQYRYKEKSSETWGNWINTSFTLNNNEFNCNDVIIALDNTKEFDIEVKVTDNLSNNNATTSIDAGKSIFFISSNERKCYINDEEVVTENKVAIYSTNEQIIGKWVNDKTIYRSVIEVQSFPNATATNIDISALNIDYVVHLYGYAKYPSSSGKASGQPINNGRPDDTNGMFGALLEEDNLRLITRYDRTIYSGYVIIEYTKRND